MLKRILALAVLGGLAALPACTSNQAAVEPHFTPVNTSTSELQFQVGTATYGANQFLNTVVTFRQPNGLSALLADTPSISLPFTNTAPAAVAFNDSGKPQITGTPETLNGVASTDTAHVRADGGRVRVRFPQRELDHHGREQFRVLPYDESPAVLRRTSGVRPARVLCRPWQPVRAELQGRLARVHRLRRIGGLVPGLPVRVHHLLDPPDDGNLRALGGSAAEQHADSDVHCHDDAGATWVQPCRRKPRRRTSPTARAAVRLRSPPRSARRRPRCSSAI